MPPRKSRSVWPTARAVTAKQAKPSFEDLVRSGTAQASPGAADTLRSFVPTLGQLAKPAEVAAGVLLFGDPNLKKGASGFRDAGRAAVDVLTSGDSSKKEQVSAGLNTLVIGGGIGFDGFRGRRAKVAEEK